jgi:hypothetical protein
MIEFHLAFSVVTCYFLRECGVKKFLHILSPIHIARAVIVVNRLNIDVCKISVSIYSVWVTKGRTVSSYFAMRIHKSRSYG